MATVKMDPFRCRLWKFHDRLEEGISERTCQNEIRSFERYGQLLPVLGRAVEYDERYDVELIYGARRLFIARYVNKPINVDVRQLSDREAMVAMDMENRLRRDVSPYERGLSYARWLRGGHFTCQEDLAETLQVSAAQVSRLLRLARLPSVVIGAFESATDICEAWGLELAEALEHPERRKAAIRAARAISAVAPRPAARDVYRQLLASSARGRRVKHMCRDHVVKDANGTALFRLRHRRSSIALMVPLAVLTPDRLAEIRSAVGAILEHTHSEG